MQAIPIWPIPQELTLREDALPLTNAVLVVPEPAAPAARAAAQLFADMIADDHGVVVPIVAVAPAGARPITLRLAGLPEPPGLPGAEGYLLTVTAQGVEAVARDARGLQHAVATLVQLAERRDSGIVLRGAEVRDWPYKPVRMVHLYLPGPDHMGYARRYLRDFLVRYKYNGLFIEVGGGTRLRKRPEVTQGWRRFVEELNAVGDMAPVYGAHVPLGPGRRCGNSVHTHLADGFYVEPDEVSRLFEWAREYHLDPVPEIQSLAHVFYLACAHREIAELPEADFPDAYCPSNPESYRILFDVMQEYLDLTKCTSLHIGHDEWRAGGLCPKCRERDTGELFAEDVLKVVSWLAERGLTAWMWGDHLIEKHNAFGCDWDDGEIWYDYVRTLSAGALLKQAAPNLTILNWSWSLGTPEEIDHVIADLGFRQIYGNLHGRAFQDWAGRSAHPSLLGGEVSSWCAWEDYELGMLHYPGAMYSANLLWSTHWPEREAASERTARELPRLRDRLRRSWEKPHLWSEATRPERRRIISLGTAPNVPRETEQCDLSSLPAGAQEYAGVPYSVGDGAVTVERTEESASAAIPIGGKYGSLIFWQVASEPGTASLHSGDGTHYPREAQELLGWYEIRYEDGLTRAAEIRYGENVMAWDEGYGLLYHAREIPAGRKADGAPLVVAGLEWTNPRPAVPIVSVTLRGAKGLPQTRPGGKVSAARPLLLGITGIELPSWGDFRPGREGQFPGWERPTGPLRQNYGPAWVTGKGVVQKPEDIQA